MAHFDCEEQQGTNNGEGPNRLAEWLAPQHLVTRAFGAFAGYEPDPRHRLHIGLWSDGLRMSAVRDSMAQRSSMTPSDRPGTVATPLQGYLGLIPKIHLGRRTRRANCGDANRAG
jgi:hypothetical protein